MFLCLPCIIILFVVIYIKLFFMKRYVILILVAVFIPAFSYAAKLHGLVFAATSSNIGVAVDLDRKHMLAELSIYANASGLTPEIIDVKGDACNPDNLNQILQNLQCGPDDVIFLYYSGHGARSYNDKNRYPQLQISKSEKDYPSLYNINEQIKSKGVRLSIVMADCCNSYGEYISAKSAMPKGSTNLDKKYNDNAKILFCEFSGNIIISSSEPGQPSICDSINGSAFTNEYVSVLHAALKGQIEPSWSKVLSYVRGNTFNVANHKPIYNNNTSRSRDGRAQNNTTSASQQPSQSTRTTQTTPRRASSSQSQTNNMLPSTQSDRLGNTIEQLVNGLKRISSAQTAVEDRISSIPALRKHFDAAGRVYVIGRDMKTVVAVEDVDTYLSRLSTGEYMKDFVLLDKTQNDSGKVSRLIVHEIYNSEN